MWWNRALEAVGCDRVARLASGGVETIIRAIEGISRRPFWPGARLIHI